MIESDWFWFDDIESVVVDVFKWFVDVFKWFVDPFNWLVNVWLPVWVNLRYPSSSINSKSLPSSVIVYSIELRHPSLRVRFVLFISLFCLSCHYEFFVCLILISNLRVTFVVKIEFIVRISSLKSEQTSSKSRVIAVWLYHWKALSNNVLERQNCKMLQIEESAHSLTDGPTEADWWTNVDVKSRVGLTRRVACDLTRPTSISRVRDIDNLGWLKLT